MSPLWPRNATVSASMLSYVMLLPDDCRSHGDAASTIIHAACRRARAKKMPRRSGAELQKSGCRSVGTPVEHGLVGLVLIREIDGLVVTQREVHVAHHLASAWTLAFHMDRKGGAVALLVQNGAETEHRIDVRQRDFHARHAGVRTVALADLIFGVGADEREVFLAGRRRSHCCQRDNAQHPGCDLDHSCPSTRKITRTPGGV